MLLRLARAVRKMGGKKVSDVFTSLARTHPDKTAILFEDQNWTFGQLDAYSNQIANFFQDAGIKPGDTVAMFMSNSPQYIGLSLGLSKIGVTASFINFNLRGNALLHCITICHPVAVVFDSALSDAMAEIYDQLDVKIRDVCFSINGESKEKWAQSFDEGVRPMPADAPPSIKETNSESKLTFPPVTIVIMM